jgi:16S rRNA (cytidine1402-2'-O)-methyltransferase
MGILYLVATPIGNLEDITLRALRILKEVVLVAAEDTRTARNLLAHFDIHSPMTSYFEHSRVSKMNQILDALAQGDVAVISEAGMPGLSDPGYELVCAALEHDYRVIPIPGANALTAALVASGLPTDQFTYVGFLPRQKSARRKLLQSIAAEPRTLVAYEAPHRICDSLDDIADTLGDRKICLARELTKIYEEFFRGTVNDARKHFAEHAPRGEFTLVIEGPPTADPRHPSEGKAAWEDRRVVAAMRELLESGVARTDAAKQVARESGRDRREVYQLSMLDE